MSAPSPFRAARRLGPTVALALLLGGALALRADVHPNTAGGRSSEGAFGAGEVDSVNPFNGALNLRIPIGLSYPVNAGFGYQLKLVYNSNPWLYQTVTHSVPPAQELTKILALPSPCSNAGLGWRISFGSLDPACQVTDQGGAPPRTVYQDEEGADHVFYPTLHEGDPEDAPLAGVSDVRYTRDGSYLRLKVRTDGTREVEFPDGLVKNFDGRGRAVEIRDPFGNKLSISYATAGQWVLTDTQGRTHRIHFRGDLPGYAMTVDRVELAAFAGGTATYQFSYTNQLVGRSCPHNDNVAPYGAGPNVTVPLLTAVLLPDGTQWKAPAGDYVTTLAGSSGCTASGGNLSALTLPTLGRLEWTWQTYVFPTGSSRRLHLQRNPGVATRAMRNPNGALLGVWTYSTVPTPVPVGTGGSKELVNSVTDPLGHKTVRYFSTALDPSLTGWSQYDYSLPFTRSQTLNVAPGIDLNLSSQVFDSAGTLLRSEYALFERDVVSGFEAPDLYNSNRRMARARTVFHDDPGTVAGSVFLDFDGLGHYRLKQTEGSFPGSNVRTLLDHFNPARGTYSVNAAANTANPGFTMLPASAPWVLDTMDFTWDAENGATAFKAVCFAPGTNKIVRERFYRLNAAAQGAADLVRVYTLSPQGNVASEKLYGGDAQAGIPTTTSDNCTMPLPASPEYQLDHTYSGGVRATSKYLGTTHFTLDRTIDASTGLTLAERDGSGVGADFEYDAMGRMTWSKPAAGHGGWTELIYNTANPATLANAYVFRRHRDNGSKGAAILNVTQTVYDFFGRLYQDQRRLPGGSFNKVETLYDAAGNRASVSENVSGAAGKKTQFFNYDPFGRPALIRPADGPAHDVTLVYRGVRQADRTVKVATGAGGAETSSTRTETYDRHGRLVEVSEPSGTGGAQVGTLYGYDVGNRLASVQTTANVPGSGNVTQSRTFTYDRAGLLQSESGPERGTVTIPRYDSAGRPLRQVEGANDLTYVRDAAQRVTQIRETGGAQRVLKAFTYGTANGTFTDPATGQPCTDYRKGKVSRQSRFNYVTVNGGPFAVELREGMTYCGRDGRESRRTLENYVNGAATPNESFVLPSLTYDPLGNPATVGYPQCTHAGCAAPTPRTVRYGYTEGLLTSVGTPADPGYYASSLTYHPNLQLSQVVHNNDPGDPAKRLTDTFAPDPDGIARPASIAVTTAGGAVRWSTGDFAYDGAGSVKAMGLDTFRYDKVGRLTASSQYLEPVAPATLRSQTFSYDPFGNLLAIGGNGARNTPTAPATNHLAGGTYDTSGNLTAWNGNLYDYGPFDQMWRYRSGGDEWIYLYTAEDERAWSFKVGNSSLWTLRDPDGRILREYATNGGAWTVERDYVYRVSALLAAETPAGTRHLHLDHLGSPRLVTDALGQPRAFHVYHPFGDEATAFNQDDLRAKFTGHERDLGNPASPADDLDLMHARHYSPLTGRFLSTDILPARPVAPQSWNRYSYVQGNPLSFVDPTGLGRIRFVGAVVELGFDGLKALRRLATKEELRLAHQAGEDILTSEKLGYEIATEAGGGRAPIFEHGKGKNQFPHLHPADRSGGHIFVREVASGLTVAHYVASQGPVIRFLGDIVDALNPLSLGQDVVDLYDFFVEGPVGEFVGELEQGIKVTAHLARRMDSMPAFYFALHSQSYHTGDFVSTGDLFRSGNLCIEGICMSQ